MSKPKESEKSGFFKEFETFINQGSVVDLAVGMVIGTAFTKIVTSLVNDVIMPIVGILLGGVNFTTLSLDVPNIFGANTSAHLAYGNFIQNVVDFLIVAFCLFVVVSAMNALRGKATKATEKISEKNR